MSKPTTYPTLFDEALQISISKLKAWGCLKPQQVKTGSLKWVENETEIASISIISDTTGEKPFIELVYKYKDESRRYKVFMTSIPSNLNKGEVWYFICPKTNKRCRKLYAVDGYFYHREAFSGMYKSQVQSKTYRRVKQLTSEWHKLDRYWKKNFKTRYAGKPTKKFKRIMMHKQKLEKLLSELVQN